MMFVEPSDEPEQKIDLPYGYCVIDVLLCMGFTDGADLSIESEHGHIQMELTGNYHIMCEDCLCLCLSKQG